MDTETARTILQAKEADLLEQVRILTTPQADQGTIGFGKRIGEGTSLAVHRFTAVTVQEQLLENLDRVRAALARLDDGTYGVCEVCGEPISDARLEVRPWATRCITDS